MKPSPENIASYLVDFEASLCVGLSRRRQILAEVEDHLQQVTGELTAKGTVPSEAEREAIIRFGSPEAAAARFGRDLAGVLDGRLFAVAGRHDRWRAEHPWTGTLVLVSPLFIAYGIASTLLGSPALDVLRSSIGLWAMYLSLALRARAVATRTEPGFRARAQAWDLENPWGMALVRAFWPVGMFLALLASGKANRAWLILLVANASVQLLPALLGRPRRPGGTVPATVAPVVAPEPLPYSSSPAHRPSRVALAGIAVALSMLILTLVVRPGWSDAAWFSISALPWVALMVVLPANIPLRRWLGRHPFAAAALFTGALNPTMLAMSMVIHRHSSADLSLLGPGLAAWCVVQIGILGIMGVVHQRDRLSKCLRTQAEQPPA